MPERLQKALPDLLIVALLLIVPLILFFPQTIGGKTLLPVDNLFAFQPYRALAGEYGISQPHNGLISDLILENYVWKQFVRDSIASGEVPLWQPYILAGTPFLAAGQSSALYPFSVLFWIMPLASAYGWFTVLQLWVAGLSMYLFARVLGLRRLGGLVAGMAYQLSGFFLVSVVFPMIIATAAWLPLELAMIELAIRQAKALGRPSSLPWVVLGALGLGMAALAGHVEALYFTLLVMAFYAAWRLIAEAVALHRSGDDRSIWRWLAVRAGWLVALVGLGLALGAVQIIPAYELASRSFREGAVTLAQVRGWAYPPRHVLAFFMPNVFGNPAYHSYFDVFNWQVTPVTVNAAGQPIHTIFWGIKNYVEGGAYLGLLPMVLAGVAILHWGAGRVTRGREADPYLGAEGLGRPYRILFAVLAVLSVSFIFGLPTYALLYYGLPFINQSHSPFRWVWPLTLSVAVLAGFGAERLQRLHAQKTAPVRRTYGIQIPTGRVVSVLAWACIGGGGAALALLVLSRAFYGQIEGVVQRIFEGLALAPEAFPDGRAFYSFEAQNVLIFALTLIAAGVVLRLALSKLSLPLPNGAERLPLWEALAVILIAVDLGGAMWGFYPANDPRLLDVTPPAISRLQADTLMGRSADLPPGDYSPYLWRFMPYEVPGADTMNANIGWLNHLQDGAGYDSLIPAQYADYMRVIQPQDDLAYNRIAPIYTTHPDALDSPLLDLLGVRYIVTETTIDSPKYRLAYQDEAVRIYENLGVMPRAFTLPASSTAAYPAGGFAQAALQYDVRQHVLLEEPLPCRAGPAGLDLCGYLMPAAEAAEAVPAAVTVYSANEVWVDVEVSEPSWLIVTDSYFPGWRAWIRPLGAGDEAEQEVNVHLVNGNFRGVLLPAGTWTVRMKYSPDTFKLGAFASFMAGMMILFVLGVWGWRYIYREEADISTARRVAKNSLTPILLNLFNRGIQFAFAFVSLRMLGPAGSGKYQYAVVIWGWFEILSNFGLNTLLTREVARDRSQANRYLSNTTVLRLWLAAAGVPLLVGFLAVRQLFVDPPLEQDTLWTIGLLYAGLFLSTISTGLSALFYAYEKAEYPAAIQTISTMLTACLGVLALLAGWGIIGLAGVSIVVSAFTLIVMGVLTIRLFFRPRLEVDGRLQRQALWESFPLMINHLLATLFFRVDIILLEFITRNNTVVGWYGIVYKWIDALNVIPSFFTAALFPVMSRQAAEDRPALLRSYTLSIKLLTLISLPVAVITTLLAYFLVGLLGGPAFLPHGAVALQLFVWSIPIGWINSVTNYVLIALNRQRVLTWAFLAGTAFNVGANLYFIPRYSYLAAAVITSLSELVLLTCFYLVLLGALGRVAWVRLLWKIGLAAALMAAATWALAGISVLLALVGGVAVYGAAIFLLRPFNQEERERLSPLMPSSRRQAVEGQGSKPSM